MKLRGRVEGVYTGGQSRLSKSPEDFIRVELDGIEGDKHRGFVRNAGSRDQEYVKGAEIRNNRMWSAVSSEELEIIAQNMCIRQLTADVIGANLCICGIPNFSELPKGTRLCFPGQAILLVESINIPCTAAGAEIQRIYGEGKPQHFPKAAWGKRGLVGVVERSGVIRVGDAVDVEVYEHHIQTRLQQRTTVALTWLKRVFGIKK